MSIQYTTNRNGVGLSYDCIVPVNVVDAVIQIPEPGAIGVEFSRGPERDLVTHLIEKTSRETYTTRHG